LVRDQDGDPNRSGKIPSADPPREQAIFAPRPVAVDRQSPKQNASMYPAELVAPMKSDLTTAGFQELNSPEQVDKALTQPGTVLCVVNSVCGCAAGAARPGVKHSLLAGKRPDHLVTVFAGVDTEAVHQARRHFLPYPPSSPSMALFKDGKLVHVLERHHIEGRSAGMIAENLMMAYEEFC
jgi:putative YphP/YqiW family bacilliredoxin